MKNFKKNLERKALWSGIISIALVFLVIVFSGSIILTGIDYVKNAKSKFSRKA